MGKKYAPSGYQIIEIDVDKVDSDGILLKSTDDAKLLYKLFKTGDYKKKPILLHAYGSSLDVVGMAVTETGAIQLSVASNVITLSYVSSDDEITVDITPVE